MLSTEDSTKTKCYLLKTAQKLSTTCCREHKNYMLSNADSTKTKYSLSKVTQN